LFPSHFGPRPHIFHVFFSSELFHTPSRFIPGLLPYEDTLVLGFSYFYPLAIAILLPDISIFLFSRAQSRIPQYSHVKLLAHSYCPLAGPSLDPKLLRSLFPSFTRLPNIKRFWPGFAFAFFKQVWGPRLSTKAFCHLRGGM